MFSVAQHWITLQVMTDHVYSTNWYAYIYSSGGVPAYSLGRYIPRISIHFPIWLLPALMTHIGILYSTRGPCRAHASAALATAWCSTPRLIGRDFILHMCSLITNPVCARALLDPRVKAFFCIDAWWVVIWILYLLSIICGIGTTIWFDPLTVRE